MKIEEIAALIRDIPDFPKKGIIFKDITPVLKSSEAFESLIDLLCEPYLDNPPDFIAGIESRGFIFGAAMALKLSCGFIPIRKKGKLPYKTFEASYSLEYGTATLEIHTDALENGNRVVVIDDLLATGGTASAGIELLEKVGADVIGIDFVVELCFLSGISKFSSDKVRTLIKIK
jgi:adenine phosphoribosyltransferase